MRWVLGTAILVALASLALNVALFAYARARYRQEQDIRLDPTGAGRFGPKNDELSALVPGKRRVVLFGDSRIEGWVPPLSAEGVEVVNRGWWGETTGQAILRLDRDVIQLRPSTVVIEFGINDLKGIGLLPDREAEIVETCRRNLESIVGRLREKGIGVILLTIFPVGPVPLIRRPIWSDRTIVAVDRINREVRSLAGPGVEVVDCDGVLAEGGRMKAPFAADEFHLTPAAYEALDRLIKPRLAASPPSEPR
jgi:lysophospholipase L1-like esterase